MTQAAKFITQYIQKTGIGEGGLLKNSLLMICTKVLGMFFGYLFTVLIAKKFGVEILGNFSVALVFLNFFSILAVLGLDVAMVTFKNQHQGSIIPPEPLFKQSFSTIVTSGALLLLGCVLFLISPMAAILPDKYTAGQYILLAVVPLGLIRLQANYFRRANKLLRFAFLNYLATNALAVLFLLLGSMLYKAPSVIVSAYVAAIVVVALFGVSPRLYLAKTEEMEEKSIPKKTDVLTYSLPLMVYQLIENGYDWIVILLAGIYLPNESVGIIALIIKISSIFNFIDSGVNSASLNKMSEYYFASHFKELAKLYRSSIKIIVGSNIALVVVGIVLVPYLFSYLGPVFSQAIVPLALVFLAKVFESYVAPLQSLLPVLQKQKALMKLYLLRSLVLLILLIIFIPIFGIIGISIAICLTAVIYVVTVLIYVKYSVRFLHLSTAD